MEMGSESLVPGGDSRAVYSGFSFYVERTGKPACICRISCQYLCVLVRCPAEYTFGQSYLCFTMLADI